MIQETQNNPVQIHKEKVNIRRLLTIACLAALVISYLLPWLRMITDPVQYTGSDFIIFYTAGKIGERYGLDKVYDFNLQKAVQEEVVGFEVDPSNVLPYNHMPFNSPTIMLLMKVTGGRFLSGFIAWTIGMIALFYFSVGLVRRTFSNEVEFTLLTWLASLLFFPFFVSLMHGQDTALLFLGCAILYYGILKEKSWAAGLGLAMMTVRPHIALLLGLPFLFRRRDVWWWFCAGAGILVLVSLLQLGLSGVKDFVRILLDTANHWRETGMVNFIGLTVRTIPGADSQVLRWVGWGFYLVMLGLLCGLWRKSRHVDGRTLSLGVVGALFAAPHLFYHDLSLIFLPILVVLAMLLQNKKIQQKDAPLILLGTSTILLLSYIAEATVFLFTYALMAGLFIILWRLQNMDSWWQRLFHHPKKVIQE